MDECTVAGIGAERLRLGSVAVYEDELAFGQELANRADEISTSYFRSSFRVRQKEDGTPVTEADLAVEEALREALGKRFPDDAVLGEEHGLDGRAGRTWVLDPIDGTKNFAAGIQIWGTLIALLDDGAPVVGVVSAPALGERYAAARGAGSTLNGESIGVSWISELSEAFLLWGDLSWTFDGPRADAFRGVAQAAARTRAFGDFWAHMLVARGAAHAMIEQELRVWDWAALKVVVEEAGGRVTQLDGSPPVDGGSVLTSNGALHELLVTRLSPASG
jgi:histidinol-phosphatase